MASIKQLIAIAGGIGTAIAILGTVGISSVRAIDIDFAESVTPFGVEKNTADPWQPESGTTDREEKSEQEGGDRAVPSPDTSLPEYSIYLEYAAPGEAKLPKSNYLDYQRYTTPPQEVPEPFSAFSLLALGVLGAGYRFFQRTDP